MLDEATRRELEDIISANETLLGLIFSLTKQGITDPIDLVNGSGAANRGVVYNLLTTLRALLEEQLPTGATMSRRSGRMVGKILRDNPEASKPLIKYLGELKGKLEANSESIYAALHDQERIDRQSAELAKQATHIQKGIYVYSFPTYLHFGTIGDQDVSWFKIGSTNTSVWQRIVDQNRQTSMPEDPKLLRIYHREGMDAKDIESKFHRTLDRVGHERSSALSTKAGTEWFATTLDAIDAMAELMNLEIERYQIGDDPS